MTESALEHRQKTCRSLEPERHALHLQWIARFRGHPRFLGNLVQPMPERNGVSLEKIGAKYRDQGLAIFGVNQQEQKLQTDFLKKKPFSYPMLFDRSGMLSRRFRASELPTLVVIDRNGRIVDWEQGMQKQEELESLLQKLTAI